MIDNTNEEIMENKNITPTGERIRSFIERIEKVEEERSELTSNIKEIKAELKSEGFCVKTVNNIIRIRKMDSDDRAESEALLDSYLKALNMK